MITFTPTTTHRPGVFCFPMAKVDTMLPEIGAVNDLAGALSDWLPDEAAIQRRQIPTISWMMYRWQICSLEGDDLKNNSRC